MFAPISGSGPEIVQEGMSLRDYFAGQVLCGMLGGQPSKGRNYAGIADNCYIQADAMLKAREVE